MRFHNDHALGFSSSDVVREFFNSAGSRALDIGAGGGLPGLILAAKFDLVKWTFIDSRKRSVDHLREAVAEEGLEDRVEVVSGRAEELARLENLREGFGLVTARGFGPPSVTAEIGAGFVAVGGYLVVSEPPDGGEDRWDAKSLTMLSLEMVEAWSTGEGHYRRFVKVAALDDRYPRRTGTPKKRPLF